MAEKPKKPQKLKARLPRGLEDRGPAAINATRQMVEKIRTVYERYGFEPVETPAFEYTDALGKFLPDQDRPNEGVFSFQDDDEQWISLRYDLTAPLARYVAERYGTENLVLPYRSYRVGYVFRNEKPGPGRFRQFMQFDADTVGAATPAADAEMCMMAADAMEELGIPRDAYVVKVNNRKVLDGVMESIGLGGEDNADKRLLVLRAIDKLDRLGTEGVRLLLGEGRWDGGAEGKGDFTKGAELKRIAIEKLMVWLTFEEFFAKSETGEVGFGMPNPFYDPPSTWPSVQTAMRPGILRVNRANRARNQSKNWDRLGALMRVLYADSETLVEGTAELEAIIDSVEAAGYGDQVLFDPSVVRGLEYYTGPVYEVELKLETKDDKGRSVRFGSVGGGGRYDGLVSRFRGETVPATGFSVGVSRLQAALTTLRKVDTSREFGPVVVTVFDRDRMADYQKMVAALRNAPIDPKKPNGPRIRAELYLGNPKNIGNQLKYADLRNAPCVVMQGSNEKSPGKGRKARVIIKDLIAGKAIAGMSDQHEEYVAKQKEAQLNVLEKHLIAKVRDVLARHDVKWG